METQYDFEFESWFNDLAYRVSKALPEHDRTSCNDENMENASFVLGKAKCERCDELKKLRLMRIEHEYKKLKEVLTKT